MLLLLTTTNNNENLNDSNTACVVCLICANRCVPTIVTLGAEGPLGRDASV